MTPLLGTKTPSASVGDRSAGDGRAARSLLSCALWRAMGRLWRGMGGHRPPRRQHGFFSKHGLYAFHESQLPYPRFPTISHDFPAFPGPPTPPPPIKCPRAVRLSWSAARTAAPPRAARSLLSCALWRGMGRLWRGMGGGSPPHGQHGLSCSPAVRYFFWSEPGPPTMVFTKHETRITAFTAVRFSVGVRGVASQETAVRTTAPAGKPLFSSSPLFTIVHHCSRLFAIVRHCSPKNIVLRQCPRAARSLLSCALWRGMGRLWRGMGGGRPPHRQHGLSGFHETRDPRPGYCLVRGAGCPLGRREFRGFHETRITRHETRLFSRMLRP